ncbi:NAD-dependent protein deacetylase SIR4 [Tolypocladium capitatum]|uniref:NAD-dependent protein deacetylase SIR4 n=1 Tax=Tolypocladium capitatum TaxID=45235 RepID=A0A2K3QHT8_9HYPO|nr:NAD-dependent protein deacetylase SIR4 [Tolypocladium capitatum]
MGTTGQRAAWPWGRPPGPRRAAAPRVAAAAGVAPDTHRTARPVERRPRGDMYCSCRASCWSSAGRRRRAADGGGDAGARSGRSVGGRGWFVSATMPAALLSPSPPARFRCVPSSLCKLRQQLTVDQCIEPFPAAAPPLDRFLASPPTVGLCQLHSPDIASPSPLPSASVAVDSASPCAVAAPMRKPLLRIPYTDILAPPAVAPASARSLPGALAALERFFAPPPPRGLPASAVILTGAGLSVASGLADYRGPNGTYRVNKTYRPVYHYEFLTSHEARQRYWARSFLGWAALRRASPNAAHYAIGDLGDLGLIRTVITQNVDSLHPKAHPQIPSLELHGYLRATVCTSCRSEFPRDEFQQQLARLNPRWADLLRDAVASGALETEDPAERTFRGLTSNPDGDVDFPEAPYTTFRYPACPRCLADPPAKPDGRRHAVRVDSQGAWTLPSTAGILKPAVVMFGESIAADVKTAAEDAIDGAGRLLVVGTSLATYSAWRLVKRAKDRGMPIAIVNMGGVRGEEQLFADLDPRQAGERGVRVELSTDQLLPALVSELRKGAAAASGGASAAGASPESSNVLKYTLPSRPV